MSVFQKLNDLSHSGFKKRFLEQKDHAPASGYCVGMGRVSIKKNKDKGNSDEAQIERIDDCVRENKWTLVKAWDVAETASRHDRRKNFNEMLNLVRASQTTNMPIKIIIFSHQSRSNRNRESAQALEDVIRRQGVFLVCIRDNLVLHRDSPMEDWMRWDMFNNLNEKSVKDHTNNVVDGMIKAVEEGRFPGKAPFGYRNYRPTEKSKSVAILVSGPDQYMKTAFELFVTGRHSVEELQRELDSLFPHLPKRPKAKRLHELLRNPYYYGDFIFDGQLYKGNPEYHPPLISFELWQGVQTILNGRARKKKSNYQFSYLHILRCGAKLLNGQGVETDQPCGCAVTAEYKVRLVKGGKVNTHVLYHCSRNKTEGVCSQRDVIYMKTLAGRKCSYAESEIEVLFEVVFKPLSFTPEVCIWMQDVLMQEHQEKKQQHAKQLTALQIRHKQLQQFMDSAYEDKLRGDIAEEVWREKHAKWRVDQAAVKSQIDSIDDKKEEYIQNGVLLIELAQNTEKIYKNAKPEVKRRLVEIVSSNHILRNGTIEFQYRKPFDILASASPKENWWSSLKLGRTAPSYWIPSISISI